MVDKRLLAIVLAAAGLVAFFLLLPTPAEEGAAPSAGTAPALPAGTFAVIGVRLFDGREVLPRADVLVRDGRIAAVGPDLDLPAEVATVDGAGRTLLPGLIDAHVHSYEGTLEEALRFGVTTVLDMFADPGWVAGVKPRQAADGNPGAADLYSAGFLATAPGGHGSQLGLAVPAISADTDPDAWVAARLAEGSDYVKLVLEDGHSLGLELPTLNAGQVRGLVRAAHAREVLAVAHVGSRSEARTAVAAGVDGLVHLFLDAPADDTLARRMVERGTFVVPTLTVLESLAGGRGGAALAADERLQPRLTAAQVANLRRPFPERSRDGDLENAFLSVRRLAAAGVPILAGSDAPNPGTAQGASLHRELELLVRAGLSPTAALATATAVPAEVFGFADRGRVAAGHRADLVLVAGDPTADVTASRDLVAVWKAGEPARLERPADAAVPVGETATAGPLTGFGDAEPPRFGSRFGFGWVGSTDRRMGGSSSVEMTVEDGVLRIAGEVAGDVPYPWAGAMFFPGSQPMTAVDLSTSGGLAFRARGGTAGTERYRVLLFATELGPIPAIVGFEAGPEWRRITLPWSSFGVDGSAVQGFLVSSSSQPGPFILWIDDVELLPAAE